MARRRKATGSKGAKKAEQERKESVIKNGTSENSLDSDVVDVNCKTQQTVEVSSSNTPIVHKKFGRITVNRVENNLDTDDDNDEQMDICDKIKTENDTNGVKYECDELQNVDYIMKKHTDHLLDIKTSNHVTAHSAVYKIENDIPLDGSVIIKPGAFNANTITTSVISNNINDTYSSISAFNTHELNLLNVIKGIQMLESRIPNSIEDLSLTTKQPLDVFHDNIEDDTAVDNNCDKGSFLEFSSQDVHQQPLLEPDKVDVKVLDPDVNLEQEESKCQTEAAATLVVLEDKEDSLPSQAASDSSLSKTSEDVIEKKTTNEFRSRSGSTDTTESENSSNSSSVIRRSNRLRSFKLKNKERCVVIKSEQSSPLTIDTSNCFVKCVEQPGSPSSGSQVSNVGLDNEKPVKVKSRWRRSSELEMHVTKHDMDYNDSSPSSLSTSPVVSSNKLVEELPADRMARLEREAKDIIDGLSTFVQLEENEYKMERMPCKETKRMTCDCFLTKEEIARNEVGCGEDCLNRMLFLECGSRCALGEKCTNKRFQRREYAKCNIVKTDMKGFGLRAEADLPSNFFIMEYVGEVVNPKDFSKRVKMYAKDKNRHFYFMALKADTIIDATIKGSVSRFINHSCDPNAETQKWTINGELRVGFFTTRPVSAGEEITFDYQFQLYGKAAQKCYCGAAICRGWIGKPPKEDEDEEEEEDDEEEEEESEEEEEEEEEQEQEQDVEDKKVVKKKIEKAKVRSRKPKSLHKTKKSVELVDMKTALDDFDLEEEVQKLALTGLKNRAHTLTLSRLMVRAEDWTTRCRLLKLIREADQPCRRLFLDYHGLRLICGWMVNNELDGGNDRSSRCVQILETLAQLPIPHKTMLVDSKVLSTVESWAKRSKDAKVVRDRTPSVDEDDSKKIKQDIPFLDDESQDLNKRTDVESEKQIVDNNDNDEAVVGLAETVLESWSSLKEGFKIPKKERIEEMKEHEREADRGYKEYLDKQETGGERLNYDRYGRYKIDRLDRKRSRESPTDPDWFRNKYHDRAMAKLSKAERRHLFALKVQQKDEEARKQQEMWKEHEARCLALGLDPNSSAAFDPNSHYPVFYDHNTGTWQHAPPNGPPPMYNNGPMLPDPGLGCDGVNGPCGPLLNYPGPSPYYEQSLVPPSSYCDPPSAQFLNYPSDEYSATSTPTNCIPPEFIPLPGDDNNVVQVQPQSSTNIPKDTPLKLPPKWKSAKDDKGRTYYYHVKDRSPQWEPPKWSEEDARAEAVRVLAAEMDDSSSSSESSDTSSDEEEEEEDEEEAVEEVEHEEEDKDQKSEPMEIEDVGPSEDAEQVEDKEAVVDSPVVVPDEAEEEVSDWEDEDTKEDKEEPVPSPTPVPHPKRREGLVQEIIISPRREEDRVDPRKYKEVKLMLKRQKEEARAREKMRSRTEKQRSKKKKKKDKNGGGSVGSSGSSTSRWSSSSNETSADRRIKENFKNNIAGAIVSHLNHYRRLDCKTGRITSNDDFKHLARKLTHFVMLKELKHCLSVEDLVCNDSVKTKARDFIKKYMIKFGPVYKRPKDED